MSRDAFNHDEWPALTEVFERSICQPISWECDLAAAKAQYFGYRPRRFRHLHQPE
jgi:hypothetical protein